MSFEVTPPDTSSFELDAPKKEQFIVPETETADAERSPFVDLTKANLPKERQEAQVLISRASSTPSKSVEFKEILSQVENYGSSAVERASNNSNRILQRSSTSQHGAKKSGDNNQQVVAASLGELRQIVDELAPRDGDLSPVKKIMGIIPFGNNIQKYFRKYETSQTQLNKIIEGLEHGKDSLLRDNAEIKTERVSMWESMQELARAKRVVDCMHAEVTTEIARLENSGRTEDANVMKADILFAVNQRRQDLTTQFAVTAQAYMTLDLIEKNNKELIKGVKRAQSVTVTALRNAVVVANALAGQQLVLNKIEALNSTTNSLIDYNSKMLQENTLKIHQQASSSTIDPAVIERSFKAIEDTMTAIDKHKVEANSVMEATTDRLEEHIKTAQNNIKRSRSNQLESDVESNAGGNRGITR